MAVAPDARGTQTKSATNNVTTFSFTTLTVGAGLLNSALVVILQFDHNVSSITCNWDSAGTNQAMTRIGSGVLSGSDRAEIFALIAPTSGNKTLKISWTTGAQVVVQAASFSGVDQTGGTTSFANVNTATATSLSAAVAVTSAAGDMVFASVVTTTSFGGSWSATNGTLQTGNYTDNTPSNISGAGAWALETASPVTLTAALSGSAGWGAIGFDLVAAGAAAFTFFPQSQPDMAFLLRKAEMVGY